MAKCIVVADDLTGANATGVLLKKNGFDTLTLLHSSIGSAGSVGECDCLVFPTDMGSIVSGMGNNAFYLRKRLLLP